MLQPPNSAQQWCFISCLFERQTLLFNKNATWDKKKTKIRKRDLKEKTRQETKNKRKDWWRKQLPLNILMLFLSWNKSKEERKGKKETKTRNQKKAKKKDKKEERKKRRKERDRERETEKEGGQKRLREKERETLKINKKCPFLGEKQVFFFVLKKERKTRNKTKKGGFRAKWTSPDP